jgi:sucrose-6-phosphate hydrolase SacC (GH32 family)
MSHWVYAKHAPTGAWQGAMTCPRELTLRSTPAGPRLFQSPAREWDALRAGAPSFAGDVTLGPEPVALPAPYLAFEIIAEIEPGGASGEVVCFRLWRGADGRGTVVGWDGRTGELFVDRRRAAGPAALGPQFFARYAAPLPPAPDGRVRLRLLVDACSVEAFGNGGAACLTALVFPEPGDTGLEAYATGGTARLHALTLAPLTAP